MKTLLNKTTAIVVLLLAVTLLTNAQVVKINPKISSVVIKGTSNLHDWESKTQQVNGQISINYSSKQVNSMAVEIPVKSIKSGEKLMDSKTYEAFNADKYPTIVFKLVEVNSLQISPNVINVTVTGNLTLAGVTKRVSVKATGKPGKDDSFTFTGTVPVKMTDFKIDPPTAMMGMLKVGNNVTLKFDVTVDGVQTSQL